MMKMNDIQIVKEAAQKAVSMCKPNSDTRLFVFRFCRFLEQIQARELAQAEAKEEYLNKICNETD